MTPPDALRPQRHEPPEGWSPDVFDKVTTAIASALVTACWRAEGEKATREVEVGASLEALR